MISACRSTSSVKLVGRSKVSERRAELGRIERLGHAHDQARVESSRQRRWLRLRRGRTRALRGAQIVRRRPLGCGRRSSDVGRIDLEAVQRRRCAGLPSSPSLRARAIRGRRGRSSVDGRLRRSRARRARDDRRGCCSIRRGRGQRDAPAGGLLDHRPSARSISAARARIAPRRVRRSEPRSWSVLESARDAGRGWSTRSQLRSRPFRVSFRFSTSPLAHTHRQHLLPPSQPSPTPSPACTPISTSHSGHQARPQPRHHPR